MVPSKLRPGNTAHGPRQSYFDQPPYGAYPCHEAPYRDHPNDSDSEDERRYHPGDEDNQEVASAEDGNENEEATPLLPIFSAAHLDSLPVYGLTHTIRLLVVQRCETTLSWEQLRSPQISQFLVKPIQLKIRSSNFNRATLYALLANCLQFSKEGQLNPGNVGVCKTRALVAELLAMRLLKEFSPRELIDALSYDFDPLQGATPPNTAYPPPSPPIRAGMSQPANRGPVIRTSTLEIAIRAQAKRFLAHPLCVQHLETIWAGNIVFHSAADSLHRYPAKPPVTDHRHYGATHASAAGARLNSKPHPERPQHQMVRRAVTLYNPQEASLFKLSRLRVPRYRNAFSTVSYAVMLGLFLAVLVERSVDITVLEIVFWFWSAGFMLDEIVGFSEQGFSLYIISVWNAFDIGILLLFFAYYILRLYGILLAVDDLHHFANLAYDVLASTAVLLFPRWFAFLDHYRYFSQLLIAFRLMAVDLVAVLLLIGITCSGFFIAFSFSFGDDGYTAPDVAYELFQILMGFTPAAWDIWDTYNPLGKTVLATFLIICHFLVVTILISVLTNSFMTIVRNANEEHQYLFAVNVLSMVKSDALFSYIAPSNVLGWLFSPLRYLMPFRHYVKVNRTVIKATHFPVLFLICGYERMVLSRYAVESLDVSEMRGGHRGRVPTFARKGGQHDTMFSPAARVREASSTTKFKDRALEEVFSRPYPGGSTIRTAASKSRHVDTWMNDIGGVASPPMEEAPSILEQLETSRRPKMPRSATSMAMSQRLRSPSRSMALSEPVDKPRRRKALRGTLSPLKRETSAQPIDVDADDEILDDEDDDDVDQSFGDEDDGPEHGGATTPTPFRFPANSMSEVPRAGHTKNDSRHDRHASVNTIVYKPEQDQGGAPSSSSFSPKSAGHGIGIAFAPDIRRRQTQSQNADQSQPTARQAGPARPRPAMPSRQQYQSTPNLTGFFEMSNRARTRDPSFDTVALDLASDIGDNRPYNENFQGMGGGVGGGSVNTAIHGFSDAFHKRQSQRDQLEESGMMSRMILTRINTMEEGFKDLLKEVREFRSTASSRGTSDVNAPTNSSGLTVGQRRMARKMEKERAEARRTLQEVQQPTTSLMDQPGNGRLQEQSRPPTAMETDEAAKLGDDSKAP